MNWIPLIHLAQLEEIDTLFRNRSVLIFKHSIRCNISATALNRLERTWTASDDVGQTTYYLDLLAHHDISNAIAERYGVEHESPQTLVICEGKCVHVAANFGITYADTRTALAP